MYETNKKILTCGKAKWFTFVTFYHIIVVVCAHGCCQTVFGFWIKITTNNFNKSYMIQRIQRFLFGQKCFMIHLLLQLYSMNKLHHPTISFSLPSVLFL